MKTTEYTPGGAHSNGPAATTDRDRGESGSDIRNGADESKKVRRDALGRTRKSVRS
jgi:hypothetical protein